MTLQDDDDAFFEVPDQTGDNQTATLDGTEVTINSIQTALGAQLITVLDGGVEVQLSLTPVRVTVETGLFDTSYIYFPDLPEGAEITVGLSLSVLFPNDYDVPLCLAHDTLVRTPGGLRQIGDIRHGDLVDTVDEGPQDVKWVGLRDIDFNRMPEMRKHRPILIRKGAFGDGHPYRDLVVSPQHAIVFDSWEAAYLTGTEESMVPARALVNGTSVVQMHDCERVTYCHLLFDRHQVIWAHGMPVESLYLGDLAVDTIRYENRQELHDVFPDLAQVQNRFKQRARPRMKSPEAAVLMHAFAMQHNTTWRA
ncbi:Hint domain-containing protein [Sulfitobacter sp. THAF37]|uniref:Hint domain-containing protein n=1 Tax=Sulfitobacter sp. THAF37 TaxID=2587855 RepID=UPI00156267C6|nr:Hint domain-containing protein [Sulfitobacter sp. THAF37]